MNSEAFHTTNEQVAADAFNRQSTVFDNLYSSDNLIQYKRERVRKHLVSLLPPRADILELNSGTGDDAVWLAGRGHTVHATDISDGMQQQLIKKIGKSNLTSRVTYELCSFTHLDALNNKGPYDCIFSNFAGLNCTGDLKKVLSDFDGLLKPGGLVTLVILPRFCLWETLLIFAGKMRTALRRLGSNSGARAHIEGIHFRCWYYNPSYVRRQLGKSFEVVRLEGLCTFVPPSYIENFPVKYPRMFRFLKSKEERYADKWPWKSIGDYYIISLRKK